MSDGDLIRDLDSWDTNNFAVDVVFFEVDDIGPDPFAPAGTGSGKVGLFALSLIFSRLIPSLAGNLVSMQPPGFIFGDAATPTASAAFGVDLVDSDASITLPPFGYIPDTLTVPPLRFLFTVMNVAPANPFTFTVNLPNNYRFDWGNDERGGQGPLTKTLTQQGEFIAVEAVQQDNGVNSPGLYVVTSRGFNV